MAIVSIAPAGQFGVINDIRPAELPAPAWSSGKNVQFIDGAVWSIMDSEVLLDPLTEQCMWLMPTALGAAGEATWAMASPTKIYSFISNTLTNITRVSGDYTGSTSERWQGDLLSGIALFNNGVDVPQYWSAAYASVKLLDLANWPSGYKTKCIRSYKNYLIALDITKGGVRYPTTVLWSHPADPGSIPVSWDIADPTKDAGEYALSDTPGFCIDSLPLRDVNIIYKQDSVWAMQHIGGTYVFRFYKLFGDFGVQTRDCVVEYISGKHCVFTGNDLIIHDGQTAKSIVDGKCRSLLKGITEAQLATAFLVANSIYREVWLCYRNATDAIIAADTAIVYNWETGTISFRDLPDYRFIAHGKLNPTTAGALLWSGISDTWASSTIPWGETKTMPSVSRSVALGTMKLEWLEALRHSTPICYVERLYLGIAMRAGQPPDLSSAKFISRVWPRIQGTAGDQLTITLGSAFYPDGPIVWATPHTFIIGTTEKLDCTLTGKLFAIRIESQNTDQWTYTGLDVEIIESGRR